MIQIETVLVLGAGASTPYGFPTGDDLVRRVRETAGAPPGPCLWAVDQIGKTVADLKTLEDHLRRAQPLSIDEFLERRLDLEQVGKIVIALVLLNAEAASRTHLWGDSTDSHWYRYLKGQLLGAAEAFGQNKIRIITFNYDRSFEHYLFDSLRPFYPNAPDDAFGQIARRIPVLHVYGSLGPLPWQAETGSIPYGPAGVHLSSGVGIICAL